MVPQWRKAVGATSRTSPVISTGKEQRERMHSCLLPSSPCLVLSSLETCSWKAMPITVMVGLPSQLIQPRKLFTTLSAGQSKQKIPQWDSLLGNFRSWQVEWTLIRPNTSIVALYSQIIGTMRPAVSRCCHQDFPTMVDYSLKLWAKINPSSIKFLWPRYLSQKWEKQLLY